jgi:23S rRNA pseudouridine955/2504/2580 synthase
MNNHLMSHPTPDSSSSILVVTDTNIDQRIDNFLTTRLKGLPKSRLYRALRSGEVRVNKKRIKASYRLQLGDQVRIPPLRLAKPEDPIAPSENFSKILESSVIYEDKDFIVVNKPSGVASHGGSGILLGMIEAFRQLRPKNAFLELAHRLDRDTTGCLVLVKKPSILKELHGLFLVGKVKKTYLALVEGAWQGGKRTVNEPLLKSELSSGERVVVVHPEGKAAKTTFKPLQVFAEASFLEASPATGRTHQIRVHAAHMGHAILGDDKYARGRQSRALGVKHLLLHAASLQFELAGQNFDFSAALDDEFSRILNALKREQLARH